MKNLEEIKKHLFSYKISIDTSNRNNFGEIFTPTELVDQMLSHLDKSIFTDCKKTVIDSGCGNGQILASVLYHRCLNGMNFEDALSTIYGVDINLKNVQITRERLLCGQEDLRHIVEKNIVCHDALTYDYSFNGTNKNKSEALFDNLFEHEQ